MQQAIANITKSFTKPRPEIRTGYTVRVHERIQEGDKERVQMFEGLVIYTHAGHNPTDASITVRRIASGVGVEKVFAVHSPLIEKIEVKKVAEVRRAKLTFLRGRRGKSARLSERFTNAGEFAIATAAPEAAAAEPVVETPVVEAPVVEPVVESAPAAEAPADNTEAAVA